MSLEKQIEEIVRRVVREEIAAALAKAPTTSDEDISISEYARRHNVGRGTVRAAIREGRLPAVTLGRKTVRIPADAQIGEPVTPKPDEADEARIAQRLGILRGDRR